MRRNIAIVIALAVFILVALVLIMRQGEGDLYATFTSPSGGYGMEVYASKDLLVFPGHGGDAPGYVVLKSKSGNILKKKKIEMVQLVRDPQWSADNVTVHLVLDWALPPESDAR